MDFDYELASRWDRLGAFIVDSLIVLLPILAIVFFGEVLFGDEFLEDVSFSNDILAVLIFVSLYLSINGYHLKNNGQTIGKKILGIKIVSLSGDLPVFHTQILFRLIFVSIIGLVPLVGGFLDLINLLFIFGKEKRCIHDLIVKTRVIKC